MPYYKVGLALGPANRKARKIRQSTPGSMDRVNRDTPYNYYTGKNDQKDQDARRASYGLYWAFPWAGNAWKSVWADYDAQKGCKIVSLSNLIEINYYGSRVVYELREIMFAMVGNNPPVLQH